MHPYTHGKCRQIALKHLEVVAYRLYQLKVMCDDQCPSVECLRSAELTELDSKIGELRRTLLGLSQT